MLRKTIQASALLLLLAGPAAAQIIPLGERAASPEEIQQRQKEERAYNRAMEKVPDKAPASKDPWGNVRSTQKGADPAKKARPSFGSCLNTPT